MPAWNLQQSPFNRDDAKWKENLNAPAKDARPQTEVRSVGRLSLIAQSTDLAAGRDSYERSRIRRLLYQA